MNVDRKMHQSAPWPDDLEDLVEHIRPREGWRFKLWPKLARDFADADTRELIVGWGCTLEIIVINEDAYHPGRRRSTAHLFIVPAATFNRQAWTEWLFERVCDVDRHEACETFILDTITSTEDGDEPIVAFRPFAPLHGPGDNPYVVHQFATDEQRSTSWRGELNG